MLGEQFAVILRFVIAEWGPNDHRFNLKAIVTKLSTMRNITRGLMSRRGFLQVKARGLQAVEIINI